VYAVILIPTQEVTLTDQSTEVATFDRAAEFALYDPDLDFRKIIAEAGPDAYFTKGFRLVDKADLIGVPHAIVAVTYREGHTRNGTRGDYVSIEAVVADSDTLKSPPVAGQLPNPLTVFPNEPVIYNDSGTGVRRAITEHLQSIGAIDVGPAIKDFSPYDKQYQLWAHGADRVIDGYSVNPDGTKFRYIAVRGLRVSEYEYEGGDAETYYFG
jgi:hypothetical protein